MKYHGIDLGVIGDEKSDPLRIYVKCLGWFLLAGAGAWFVMARFEEAAVAFCAAVLIRSMAR